MRRDIVSLIKRYILLLAGLTIMAFGVAFSIKGNLGTSPISSVPYAVSQFTPLTVGTATIVMHCVFIVIQIAVLRKKYQLIQLMQLPVASALGLILISVLLTVIAGLIPSRNAARRDPVEALRSE